MKHLELKLILLVLLICLAFASAAFAVKPLIDGAEKSIEVKHAVEEYRETIAEIREEAEKAEENEEQHEPIPYAQLYEDMQFYNRQLYLFKQNKLDSKSAYEQPTKSSALLRSPKWIWKCPCSSARPRRTWRQVRRCCPRPASPSAASTATP